MTVSTPPTPIATAVPKSDAIAPNAMPPIGTEAEKTVV